MRRRSIIRSTRTLRIRQTNGLDISIADSTSLLRAETYINSEGFSWAFAGRRPLKDKQETGKGLSMACFAPEVTVRLKLQVRLLHFHQPRNRHL
jgi:hypothetical protein